MPQADNSFMHLFSFYLDFICYFQIYILTTYIRAIYIIIYKLQKLQKQTRKLNFGKSYFNFQQEKYYSRKMRLLSKRVLYPFVD